MKCFMANVDLVRPMFQYYLRVYKDNIASQRVMKKNGAYVSGEDEGHYFLRIKKR